MNRLPPNLPNLLRAAGVPVVEEPGWYGRGRDFPIGIIGCMQHHWGSPAATFGAIHAGHCYPASQGGLRTDSRVNCNVFSDRDGTIHLIAAGASNYSSCYGSQTVFNEIRADAWPGGTAAQRGLTTNQLCGNSYFINMEAEHAGDGSPMPAIQEQNIAAFWAVLLEVLGLSLMQYIGHNEWTARKIDPRWNGPGNRMPTLRNMVQAILDGIAPPPEPPPSEVDDIVTQLPQLQRDDGYNSPQLGGRTHMNVFVAKVQALLAVLGFVASNTFDENHRPDGKFGPGTAEAVQDFQISASLEPDGIVGPLTWTALLLHQ